MDDRYPSTDEQQSVHLEFGYPDAQVDLNRWLPLVIHEGAGDVKWRLAVFDVRLPAGGSDGWIARWVKGFRGSAPDFVSVLPGEAWRVKRLVGG
jgi:hypothetical protein